MVGNVNHGEKDTEVVFALEIADTSVDVLGMKAVVFETVESGQKRGVAFKKRALTSGIKHMCSIPQRNQPVYHYTPTAWIVY